MTAFIPEAHTLLTVEHTVDAGRPAPRAACRAGACNSHHIVSLLFTHSPLDTTRPAGLSKAQATIHQSDHPSVHPHMQTSHHSTTRPSSQLIMNRCIHSSIHPSLIYIISQPRANKQGLHQMTSLRTLQSVYLPLYSVACEQTQCRLYVLPGPSQH